MTEKGNKEESGMWTDKGIEEEENVPNDTERMTPERQRELFRQLQELETVTPARSSVVVHTALPQEPSKDQTQAYGAPATTTSGSKWLDDEPKDNTISSVRVFGGSNSKIGPRTIPKSQVTTGRLSKKPKKEKVNEANRKGVSIVVPPPRSVKDKPLKQALPQDLPWESEEHANAIPIIVNIEPEGKARQKEKKILPQVAPARAKTPKTTQVKKVKKATQPPPQENWNLMLFYITAMLILTAFSVIIMMMIGKAEKVPGAIVAILAGLSAVGTLTTLFYRRSMGKK